MEWPPPKASVALTPITDVSELKLIEPPVIVSVTLSLPRTAPFSVPALELA